jgi:hypothetical protein
VVASKAGALPEVVGDAGVLVPPGDSGSLAAALDGILTDDAAAATLGAAGHQRAATFTWSACTAAHLAAYHAALGLPAPPPAAGTDPGGGAVPPAADGGDPESPGTGPAGGPGDPS